jgi:rare lipoprotein A
MKRPSATYAALTAAALTVAVALPAAASTGTSSGGASTSSGGASPDSAQSQSQTQPQTEAQARTAEYQPAKATWYGPGLYGNRTACGATLSHRTLGVAHKRLPCGTEVALRFKGHTVVVPVIDRGPYSRGVDYDLTEATARRLGMTQTSRVAAAPLSR